MRILLSNPWVQAALTAAGVTLFCIICYLLSSVLVPLFFAFLVAYTFDPVIDYLETHGLKRMPAILLLMSLITLVILMGPIYVLPSVIDQADSLVKAAQSPHAPDIVDRVLKYLPLDRLVRTIGWVPPEVTEFNPRQVIVARVGEYISSNASDFVRLHAQQLMGASTAATATAAEFFAIIGSRLAAVAVFTGNIALFAFVAIYLLKDYDAIIAECDRLTPPRYRSSTRRIFSQIDAQLRAWLRGQAFVCLCMGTMYAIGFVLAGVPFGIILAIFGGVVSFVPFLGVALTIGPAVLLTLLKFGFDWHVVAVLVTFMLAQALEGNVITPRIMGTSVGLSPVWVILAIVVFGSTFGFAGLLLAVPIAAVLKVILSECEHQYRHSTLFLGTPVAVTQPPVLASDESPETPEAQAIQRVDV